MTTCGNPREGQIEGSVRCGKCAGRNRSVRKPAWLVRVRQLQNGKPIYDMADAERAWGKLVTLYETALA